MVPYFMTEMKERVQILSNPTPKHHQPQAYPAGLQYDQLRQAMHAISVQKYTQHSCHQDFFLSYTLQISKGQQHTCILLYVIPRQKSSAQPWMQEFVQV